MKRFIPLFLGLGLWIFLAAQQTTPKFYPDSWFCTQALPRDNFCFQYSRIAILGPSLGYVSLTSGQYFNVGKEDWDRLVASSAGYIVLPEDIK